MHRVEQQFKTAGVDLWEKREKTARCKSMMKSWMPGARGASLRDAYPFGSITWPRRSPRGNFGSQGEGLTLRHDSL